MKRMLTIVLCLLTGVSLTMGQVTLTFNPDMGVKYRYSMGMEQDMTQLVMGQEIPMKNSMITSYEMTVLEKKAEGVKVGFRFLDIYFEMSSAMGGMKYDSKNPVETKEQGLEDIMTKMFGGLLNQQFEATILPDGSVASVTGMDAIAAAIVKGMESYGSQAVQMSEGIIKQQFNNEAMRKSFEQSFKIYPGKPMQVGDSYNTTREAGILTGVSMTIQSTYQLVSADDARAHMVVKSTIDGMDGKLKGEQDGTIQFDLKTGMPSEMILNQKMEGTISAHGMEVSFKSDAKVTSTTTVE